MGRGDRERWRTAWRPARGAALVAALIVIGALAAAGRDGGSPSSAASEARAPAAAGVTYEGRPSRSGGEGGLLSRFVTRLDDAGRRELATRAWWGGAQTAASGERVTVFVSEAYAGDPGAAQRWADYFASLLHGPELATAEIYVAPPGEVQALCRGGSAVLGCYDGRRLVTIGEDAGDVLATAVAAHEYGHHVAMNRSNAPWAAVHWGPKRWASHAGVCARVGSRTAFPGDQRGRYFLNPGEAFAEAYRVLNEVRAGTTAWSWPVVDPSFRPDATALARVEQDVVQPWTAPTTRLARRVPARRPVTWSARVATPLDGDLRGRLRTGSGAHDVVLLSSDGRRVLARASWAPGGVKTLEYRVCGERAVIVRVTRHGPPAPFELSLTAP